MGGSILNIKYAWTFEYVKKPWYRRWFSKVKGRWKIIKAETLDAPLEPAGVMTFVSAETERTVHIFADGNKIEYIKRGGV